MTKINSLAFKTIVLSVLFAYLLRKKKKTSGRRKWVTLAATTRKFIACEFIGIAKIWKSRLVYFPKNG